MLIRFIVNNIFSFGKKTEFNMLTGPWHRSLPNHLKKIKNVNVLKLASIYGANGAGKSNLIKSMAVLQDMVINEKINTQFIGSTFKFNKNKQSKRQLGIEFAIDDLVYLYNIEFSDERIASENLIISGLGKRIDKTVYSRKTDGKGKSSIKFGKKYEKLSEDRTLINIIEKRFIEPNKTILKLLTSIGDNKFVDAINAFNWFKYKLQIVVPGSHPIGLPFRLYNEKDFYDYANKTLKACNLGISKIWSKEKTLKEYFGENIPGYVEDIRNQLMNNKKLKYGEQKIAKKDTLLFSRGKDGLIVHQIKLEHTNKIGSTAEFSIEEESDGIIRLMQFISAFFDVTYLDRVYVIDEIERSIHPLLIKELIQNFSKNDKSNGQLIFSTHESCLLDLDFFRQDEIWFAEKDPIGSTDLYSLSEFKQHNTTDIRKGYLTGRYGSIPIIGDFLQ